MTALHAAPTKDDRTIQKMAAHLLEYDAWRVEGDAFRSLMNRGYRAYEVFVYVGHACDAARYEIQCDLVAKEMSDQ